MQGQANLQCFNEDIDMKRETKTVRCNPHDPCAKCLYKVDELALVVPKTMEVAITHIALILDVHPDIDMTETEITCQGQVKMKNASKEVITSSKLPAKGGNLIMNTDKIQ
jgi:bifunctional pyridoxal-dependent enzyme with beta-cystathionase and maltose regulon repressor activities